MSRVKVIRAEATVNLCPNPSVERNLDGWGNFGLASLTRVATWQARGAWSARAVANTVGDNVDAGTVTLVTGLAYTVTAWVKVISGTWKAKVEATAGGVVEQTGLTAGEHFIQLTFTSLVSAPGLPLIIEATALAAGSAEILVDAVQIEQKSYATTYIDGDQDGGVWSSTPHASTSSRAASVRSGGVAVDLRDDLDLLYADLIGVGVPALSHITQPLAQRDGAILQRVKAQPALLTLRSQLRAGTLPALHTLRRALFDLIAPAPLHGFPAMRLIYSGSGDPLEIDAHYLGGLEGNIPRPSNRERIDLQFAAYDPRWSSELDVGASLAVSASISSNRIVRRRAGVWEAMGTGANGDVYSVVFAADGRIYAAGAFTTIGGVAASKVAYWDPATSTWNAMGTGLTGGDGYVLVEGQDGRIYAGGPFTGAGGVANTSRIAVWNPTTATWAALGTGMNGTVWSLVFGFDGYLYASGEFTTAGGGAAVGIARWSGSAWSNLAAVDLIATSGYPIALAVASNGDLYAAGGFSVGFGADFEDLAKWDGTAWSAVTTTPNNLITAIVFGMDGNLYLGGHFTTPTLRAGKWNGSQILPLAGGLNGMSQEIAVLPNGDLLFGGAFTAAGDLKLADRVARWNGSTWMPLPIDLPGSDVIDAVSVNGDDLILGGRFSGSATVPAVTTVTNPGSAEAYPVFHITGPSSGTAVLFSIENLTTGQEIIFDQFVISAGEVVEIDLRPGHKKVTTTLRGNAAYAVLPGSDLASFGLVPGDNDIAVLVPSAAEAVLSFRPRHWGAE